MVLFFLVGRDFQNRERPTAESQWEYDCHNLGSPHNLLRNAGTNSCWGMLFKDNISIKYAACRTLLGSNGWVLTLFSHISLCTDSAILSHKSVTGAFGTCIRAFQQPPNAAWCILLSQLGDLEMISFVFYRYSKERALHSVCSTGAQPVWVRVTQNLAAVGEINIQGQVRLCT